MHESGDLKVMIDGFGDVLYRMGLPGGGSWSVQLVLLVVRWEYCSSWRGRQDLGVIMAADKEVLWEMSVYLEKGGPLTDG